MYGLIFSGLERNGWDFLILGSNEHMGVLGLELELELKPDIHS